jgi:hypothetical protein
MRSWLAVFALTPSVSSAADDRVGQAR